MNKKALVEFVRVALLKQEAVADNQKTLHFKRVEQGVGYAFDTLLSQIPLDDKGKSKIEQFYVKHYYEQPVSESNGYRYFGVSDGLANVGNRGVWYVQPSKSNGIKTGKPLPMASRPMIAMYANIPVGGVMNTTVWRFGNIADTKQIILEDIGESSPYSNIRKVDFGVVRAFDSYGSDEEVIVPDGRNDLLIQMVITWLANSYEDKTNNNA